MGFLYDHMSSSQDGLKACLQNLHLIRVHHRNFAILIQVVWTSTSRNQTASLVIPWLSLNWSLNIYRLKMIFYKSPYLSFIMSIFLGFAIFFKVLILLNFDVILSRGFYSFYNVCHRYSQCHKLQVPWETHWIDQNWSFGETRLLL